MSNYPNLEKLESKATSLFEIEDSPLSLKYWLHDRTPKFEIHMFPQTWYSPNLGFDDTPAYSSLEPIRAYTTVFHELNINTFVVFFGEEFAYTIQYPSEIFYADLAKQKLQSVKLAKKLY